MNLSNFQHMPTEKVERNKAIFALYNAGCTKSEIARGFDLTVTRVTGIINKCQAREAGNKFLSVRLFHVMLNHGYDLTGMSKNEAMPLIEAFRDNVVCKPRASIPNFGKKCMDELNALID